MSRRPKPTGIRLVEGNRGRVKINQDEPKYIPQLTEAPSILDEIGAMEWSRVGSVLLRYNVLTEMDTTVLSMYCFAYQEWYKLCKIIREKQLSAIIQKSPNGMMMESAISTAANKYNRQMMQAAVELGLTPSARTRIKADNSVMMSDLERELFY